MANYPRLSSLTAFGFILNSELEDGEVTVTISEVHAALDEDRLWELLAEKFPRMDLSLITSTDQAAKVVAVINEAAKIMHDRERRKYGLVRNGLSMLLACILEAIQQDWWERPPKHGTN